MFKSHPVKLVIIFFVLLTFTTSTVKGHIVDINQGEVKDIKHYVFDTVHLNLKELIENAGIIFSGTCIKVNEIERDPFSGLNVVEFTFKIDEGIKGTSNSKKISFKQWKPTVKDSGYEIGQKYVLFLHGNSKLALTSPVGFLQGQFKVFGDGEKKSVKNKLGNFGLTSDIKTTRKLYLKDKKLSRYLRERSDAGATIAYREFILAIKYLAED